MNAKTLINVPLRENKKELTEIATETLRRLEKQNAIISEDPEPIITISYRVLETAMQWVAQNKSKENAVNLNFFDIFNLGAVYTDDGDGEKDGNFCPLAEVTENVINTIVDGKLLNRGLSDIDDDDAEVIQIEPTSNAKEIEKIRNDAYIILKDEHHIDTGDGVTSTTITVVFFEELFNWLVKNCVQGEELFINFCQCLDFGISYEGGNKKPFINGGVEMKLIIKDDAVTEDE